MNVPLIDKIKMVEGLVGVIGEDAAVELLADLSDGELMLEDAEDMLMIGSEALLDEARATMEYYSKIFGDVYTLMSDVDHDL